jgi:hypothetical protein
MLQERREHGRIYILLVVLDSSYEAIWTQILLTTSKLSFSEVTSLIQQEESGEQLWKHSIRALDQMPKCFMNEQNILKLTVTLLERRFNQTRLKLYLSRAKIN